MKHLTVISKPMPRRADWITDVVTYVIMIINAIIGMGGVISGNKEG